jgi:hypothetical protein
MIETRLVQHVCGQTANWSFSESPVVRAYDGVPIVVIYRLGALDLNIEFLETTECRL